MLNSTKIMNETYFLKRKCEIMIHETKILRSALNTTSF